MNDILIEYLKGSWYWWLIAVVFFVWYVYVWAKNSKLKAQLLKKQSELSQNLKKLEAEYEKKTGQLVKAYEERKNLLKKG